MKYLLSIIAMATALNAQAIDNNTVEIVYNGSTATVSIASNIQDYVAISSGTSSHVKIVQSASFAGVDATTDNANGEIIYCLSGSSTDGEFYMEGSFKATVELHGLTLANPSGPAINIQNGKRIDLSAKSGTVNTLTDGANDTYNGCFHCKGHTELKGKGTLNIVGNSKHALYSKEYIEIKNLTLNITGATKDAIHCKEYFLMKSGTVNISGAGDDGIQVELDGTTSTGTTEDHDDEDSGNFYQTGGILTISGYSGKAIKTDGSITFTGGTQNFDTADVTGIETATTATTSSATCYDLNGQKHHTLGKGLYIFKEGNTTKKILVK